MNIKVIQERYIMTQQDLWNQKFSRDGYLYGKEPNSFIASCYNNFKKSNRVLCVGEGEGRNAIFLAKKGYDVAAIDASDIGLEKLNAFAKEEGVNVQTRCIDLNDWIPTKKYGAVIASYLHLPSAQKTDIFSKIEAAIKYQGFFVIEVFSKNQLNYSSGGPKDEDLLYTVDDFKEALKHSVIHKLEEVEVDLDEGKGHQGKASVIRVIAQKN